MRNIIISLFAAALLIAGLFLLVGIRPREYLRFWLDRFQHKFSANQRRRRLAGESTKPPLLIRYFAGARAVLIHGGADNWFPLIILAALILAAAGVLAGLAANNIFLVPVLGFGLALLPFGLAYSREKPQTDTFNRSMKASLGVITYTYIQSGDIIHAVESNHETLEPPFSDVFTEFLGDAGHLGPSIPAAIRRMMEKVDDSLFKEWCRVLIQCQDNQELKYVLPLVLEKIDDTIQVQAETDTITAPDSRAFQIILAGDLLSLPLMALMEPSWLHTLTTHTGGQLTIALYAAMSFGALYWYIHGLAPVHNK